MHLQALVYFGFFFFFNDTATTEIYTLSLHDALPISVAPVLPLHRGEDVDIFSTMQRRSEEHTSELQSLTNLVCRLLLEKKTLTYDITITLAAPAFTQPPLSDLRTS